ncbi:MAG: GyrI-like domain-containing protein [Chloroflexi bacterium]|nr:GyrI-like domain-containing protein [Chloroflexota bacterium]MCI0648866.1 GyrI-like domain-containing protein [Chloroflexota bacterium]
MITKPKLEHRGEQPYGAIRTQVSIPFGAVLPPLWGELFTWLGRQGIAPAGAPFIRYLTTDMTKKLDIEVGVPVAAAVPGEERITAGVFLAGRYAVTVYTGPYDGLVEATAQFLAWAEENGVVWQKTSTAEHDELWIARIEFYLTDPAEEPDPEKWQTELAFLVADN